MVRSKFILGTGNDGVSLIMHNIISNLANFFALHYKTYFERHIIRVPMVYTFICKYFKDIASNPGKTTINDTTQHSCDACMYQTEIKSLACCKMRT